MNQTPSPTTACAQAARELAYRRWRPTAAPEAAADTAPLPSPASALALHRWRPQVEPKLAAAPPQADSDTDAWANLAALTGLAALAGLIRSARCAGGPQAMPESRTAVARPQDDDWAAWLLGGVAAVTALLLLCSPAARRNWGLVAGLGCVALAAFGPLG
jgi:hypothetical protein